MAAKSKKISPSEPVLLKSPQDAVDLFARVRVKDGGSVLRIRVEDLKEGGIRITAGRNRAAFAIWIRPAEKGGEG